MAGKLAIHYGLVHTVNGISTTGTSPAVLFSEFDSCVFAMPGLSGGSKTSDTTIFFEHIKHIDSDIWIYVPMSDSNSFADSSAAETEIKRRVDDIVSWANDYKASFAIKGVFLDEFGFDFGFANGNQITRDFQNTIVDYVHNTANMPVFINTFNIQDPFTTIGPQYGDEQDQQLATPSVGNNNNYTDWILLESPIASDLVTPSGSGTTFTHGRPMSALASFKHYLPNKKMKIASGQRFNLSGITTDTLVGLDTTTALIDRANDYFKIMQILGIDFISMADDAYAASSSKVVPADKITLSNNVEPAYPRNYADKIYSDNDTYYIENNSISTSFNDKFEEN